MCPETDSMHEHPVYLYNMHIFFYLQVTAPFPEQREKVEMGTCLGQGGPQEWAHTKEGKIIHKVKSKE